MSSYILKYARDERVKYISHLDFVRLFHRAVRRAGIPFMFSQGFNPHPVMTVAQPLSVGVTSDCEYMKAGFDCDIDETELCGKLNGALPPGYEIKAAKKVSGKEIDLTKIDRAKYTVETEYTGEINDAAVCRFLQSKELIVLKKTKSGEKESDIRPHIFDMTLKSTDGKTAVIDMTLSVGSAYNLKSETVLNAMDKYIPGFSHGFFISRRRSMTINGTELL